MLLIFQRIRIFLLIFCEKKRQAFLDAVSVKLQAVVVAISALVIPCELKSPNCCPSWMWFPTELAKLSAKSMVDIACLLSLAIAFLGAGCGGEHVASPCSKLCEFDKMNCRAWWWMVSLPLPTKWETYYKEKCMKMKTAVSLVCSCKWN